MSEKRTVNALEKVKSLKGGFLNGGALTAAYAAVNYTAQCPSGVIFAAYSGVAGYYFACTENAIYYSDDGLAYAKLADLIAGSPFMLEDGTPAAVVFTYDKAAVFKDCALNIGSLPANLSCGVVHCGRVFGADGFEVLWSGGGMFDWSQAIDKGGRLTLEPARGEVLNMLEFCGKIVAVRGYGLTVLNMFGSPENFSVGITDTDCDAVFKNTAAVVGDKLMFCSASGVKIFDGSRITSLSGLCAGSPVCAVSYAGKYYLACTDGILCTDADGVSCIIPCEASALFVSDGVFACCADGIKKLAAGGEYIFESAEIDFGTRRRKTLTAIEVSGTADITVSNGKYTRRFLSASGIIRPRLRGKSFTVTAAGTEPLSGLKLCAEVRDAV